MSENIKCPHIPKEAILNHDPCTVCVELFRLRAAISKEEEGMQQVLGKALGYPWLKDSQDIFPGYTEADGVCVGDNVSASLADEAARTIVQLRAERDKLQAFKNWVHSYLDAQGVPHHPPGTHGAEGCRIGDRMDHVFAELVGLRNVNALLSAGMESQSELMDGLKQENRTIHADLLASGERIEKLELESVVESMAEAAHDAWMKSYRDKGYNSRRAEWGEEFMVPFGQLSDQGKELDRVIMRAILEELSQRGLVGPINRKAAKER